PGRRVRPPRGRTAAAISRPTRQSAASTPEKLLQNSQSIAYTASTALGPRRIAVGRRWSPSLERTQSVPQERHAPPASPLQKETKIRSVRGPHPPQDKMRLARSGKARRFPAP